MSGIQRWNYVDGDGLFAEDDGYWVTHRDHLTEIEILKMANELDRRALHAFVHALDAEITSRLWLIEGRGSYEWDDDTYRKEFGWAVHAIQEKLEPLRKVARDLTNCPETDKGVDSVRKLEQENDRLRKALELIGTSRMSPLEYVETARKALWPQRTP